MKKRLVTSALPYVNNIPHLGNLIQVLSADVFARFCRLRGYETMYICGTDEYGTATETKALEEGISPKELCDRYYTIHADIYRWFNISFDKFGRTSTPEQTEITQHIFLKLDENGYIKPKTVQQLYCKSCDRYLADRYVRGTCPHCGYDQARGDQCENCGKLLDPTDLIAPRCGVCGASETLELRETNHLYIDLPAILPKLQAWMDMASREGFWARNAVKMTQAWIRDGLHERSITRDLKWGIPVPKDGYRDKVIYVWFDAPIGYISITATLTDQWRSWWQNPDNVELFQFIGKDNIPFHTVIFPSSLLGTGERWTMLHHMSSTEYMNYETGKFSKSLGVGVFGNDVQDTGIPADVWRFYIYYNRPERSDALFTWDDFQEKVNGELIGNLGNLVNRTLTFLNRYFDGSVPEGPLDEELWRQVRELESQITDHLERAELRDGFRKVFALSSMGNKYFQDGEPWRTRKTDPDAAAALLKNLVYLVRDLAILCRPYIPTTSERMAAFLDGIDVEWGSLAVAEGITRVHAPEILFERLEDDLITSLRERFSGTQKERQASKQEPSVEDRFSETVDLRVARIVKVERHPKADKLYIETIDVGGEERRIVSGLVPYYREEELQDKKIVIVANLKPAKLRGVESQGMLLAAEKDEIIEVLFPDAGEPGDPVRLKGKPQAREKAFDTVDIDTFFSMPLTVRGNTVYVGEAPLVIDDTPLTTSLVADGIVG